MQPLLHIIEEESRKKELELNSKKKNPRSNGCQPKQWVFTNQHLHQWEWIRAKESIHILGTLKSSDGHNNIEIAPRIVQVKIGNEIGTNK